MLLLKLLLDSPELNAPLFSPLHEQLLCIWEGVIQIKQVFLGETEAVRGALHRRFIALTGSEVLQNLIVAEVVGGIDLEVFVDVFQVETKGDAALEDQVQLTELLSTFDDSLVGNEHSAVELGREVADELLPALHAHVSILVLKNVLEVI